MARYDLIAVYIMASQPNGTLYVGVTSDLLRRGFEHREGTLDGFAKKYGGKTLVWWEEHFEMKAAIEREKQLKAWNRRWKLELIEKDNSTWRDLYEDLLLPRHLRKDDKGDELR
ncbi:MAG: GIY-YIG nuclease family protein [Vitreimonas sp.]